MGNNILLKKSSVTGKAPLTTDLQYGEVAINYADGKLYYKTNSATVGVLNPTESNNFQTIAVSGQSSIVAGSATATVNFSPSVGLDITTNAGTNTVTFAHSDTSTVGNINSDNGAGTVIQDVALTFDTFGHVTAASVGTVNLDSRYLQAEVDTLNTVTTRGATTTNAITVGGLTVNGDASVTGSLTTIDAINFHTTTSITDAAARLYWDATFGLLRVGTGSANVSFDLGMTTVVYATNADSVNITKGQVVYLSGAQGNRPTVKLALNTSDTTSSRTLGFAAENINVNQAGYIITGGVIEGLSLGAYTPGDILWLGSSAGTFTTTKPVAPYHGVFLGVVQRANNGNGQIYVKVQNGYELDEIHDVQITSPNSNDSLFYDSSTSVWKNYAPSAARTNLGLGTIATQNANSVAITGGAIDGTPIGATTPSTGKFTTLQTTGNVTVSGNLTVQGTTTTVSATNLAIADNLIYLNDGSTNTNPDLGFAGNYNDGTYRHTGFFRDATDGYWKVFKNYTPEPDASIYIDTGHASFALADIQAANFRGALVGNASTATTLQTARTINGVSFDGSANIVVTANTTNTLTLGDGLSGTSFNGSAAVTAAVDSTIARRADVHYIGTTSVALNRASAALALTGISSVTAPTDLVLNSALYVNSTGNLGIGRTPNSWASGYYVAQVGASYFGGALATRGLNTTPYAQTYVTNNAYRASDSSQDATGWKAMGGHIPSAFVIGGNAGAAFKWFQAGWTAANADISWTEAMTLSDSGNLGIATYGATPGERLEVNGNIKLSAGGYIYGDTTTPYLRLNQTNGTFLGYSSNSVLSLLGSVTTLSAGSNYLGLITNGSERLRIDSSGNVGIGTTSPVYRLDISGVDNDAIRIRNSSGTQSNGIALGVGQNSPFLDLVNGVEFRIKGNTYANLGTWNSGNNTKFIIDASGNVGINTASPGYKLDVNGTIAARVSSTTATETIGLQFWDGTNKLGSIRSYNTSGYLQQMRFYTTAAAGSSEALGMTIDSNGYVGIGTSTPSVKLHVAGNAKIGAVSQKISLFDDGNAHIHSTDGTLWLNSETDADVRINNQYNGNVILTNGTGKVGIGTGSPSQPLHVAGNARITGALYDSSNSAGTSGQVLTSTGTGTAWSSSGASVTGSGTTNYIAKFTGSTALGNSVVQESGGKIGINTGPGCTLDISGAANSDGSITFNQQISSTAVYSTPPATGVIAAMKYNSAGAGAGMGGWSVGKENATDGDYASYFAIHNRANGGAITEKIRVSSAGNVGIATTTPSTKLHVVDNTNLGGITIGGNGANTSLTLIGNGGGGGTFRISTSSGGHGEGDGKLFFQGGASGTTTRIAIDSSGNVGIGTSSPGYKLDVNGEVKMTSGLTIGATVASTLYNVDGTLSYYSSSNGVYLNGAGPNGWLRLNGAGSENYRNCIDVYGSANDLIRFRVANADRMSLTGTGLGIGTTSPAEKLDVYGNVRVFSSGYPYIDIGITSSNYFRIINDNPNDCLKIGKNGNAELTLSAGNLGIGTASPSQKLDVQGNVAIGPDTVHSYSTLTTTTTTANQVITAVSSSAYRTAKFIVQATDATGGKYQSQEILAVHNGSTAAHTEYTAINVGGAVATYDVDISGGTLRLLCTPLTTNSTVFKVQMVLIKA